MSWRLLAVLLLWPWAALAHQSGNSYLRIDHGATALSVQIEFPVKDLGALLQDPSLGPAPTREQLAQQQLPLAHAIAGSLVIEADGRPVSLAFESQQVALRNDGLYVRQRHLAPALPAETAAIVVRYGFFNGSDRIARAFVQLASGERELSHVFDPRHATQRLPLREESLAEALWTYAREGTLHIWSGPDHLLFLLCLLLPALRPPTGRPDTGTGRPPPGAVLPPPRTVLLEVAKVVTAFTVAHSVTLSLAALHWISLPARLTESAIAASVLLAAAMNLQTAPPLRRWQAAFAFGLVHGFGFASAVDALGVPGASLLPTLLGFNLGVELGQLAVVAALLPLGLALRGRDWWPTAVLRRGSQLIALLALLWLVERAFDLTLWPLA